MIHSDTVSRQHAVIVVRPDGASIEDLGSKNGTFVGGRRIRDAVELEDGAQIRLGSVRITVNASTPGGSTITHIVA